MRTYKSHHEDIDIPDLDILTLLFESEWCAANEETVIHAEAANPSNSITKSQARETVKRIAHVLRRKFDIGKGNGAGKDVVLSVASGSPFIPVLFYSIVAAAGVYSGASGAFTVSELARQMQDANAKLLLCSPEYEELTVAAAKKSNIPLPRILIIDAKTPGDWKLLPITGDRTRNVLDLQHGPQLEWKRITTQHELEQTTTCLMYSSGTTGLPKGVLISHRNLVACNVCGMHITKSFLAQREREGRPFEFRTIAHLPMAHIGGISWSSLNPFYLGGTAYWVDKYDFDAFIEYHRRYKLTTQWTVPPIWLAIAKSAAVTDHFDTLQIACTGAAPMGPELTKEATRKLGTGKIPIIAQLWGEFYCVLRSEWSVLLMMDRCNGDHRQYFRSRLGLQRRDVQFRRALSQSQTTLCRRQ